MATIVRVGVAVLVGFVIFVVLVPTSGAGSRCYSLLAFEVPCQGAIAAGAGAASAAVVGAVLRLVGRRRMT